MTDETKPEHEHDDGGITLDANKSGFKAWLPKELVTALSPAIARWTVPILSVAAGIVLVCYGIAKIVAAWKGVAPQ